MKPTQGELNKRIELIAKVIIFGGEFSDIKDYAAETDEATRRPWNVCDRTLCNYQRRAYDLIEQQVEKTRDKVWARHIQQRRQMFALAMESGDLSSALQIAKDEAELHGIYPAAGKAGGDTHNQFNVYVDASGTRITLEEFRELPIEDRLRILRGPIPAPIMDRGQSADPT